MSDKILIIENLLERATDIIIGGGMAYTFFKAKGGKIGNSLCEEDRIDTAIELLKKAEAKGVSIHLPSDSTLEFPGRFSMRAPRLPAPIHLAVALARARGLTSRDRWAAMRMALALRLANFALPAGTTVAQLLDAHRQTQAARDWLWGPLCVAALNTPLAVADAQVFANVLRDALFRTREDSDLLISGTTSLSSNLAALGAILAEWTSSHNLLVKLANVTGLLPLPGRLHGNFALTPNVNVFGDNSVDTLSGGDGSDLYYVTLCGLNGDVIHDNLNSFAPSIAILVFGD